MTSIADHVAEVRGRIAAAAVDSGRSPDAITLVAVTKYVGLAQIEALLDAGCCDLGESRPQVLWQKADEFLPYKLRWHLVGHLQRNKVERTLPKVALIHSADSLRLVRAIDEISAKLGRRTPVLLEVNISGDQAKHGFAADELEPVLAEMPLFRHVDVRGLMTMAALEGTLDVAQRNFADLRKLRDRLQASAPPEISLRELSMGMSRDFEEAIREGATIVRIGSALFDQEGA